MKQSLTLKTISHMADAQLAYHEALIKVTEATSLDEAQRVARNAVNESTNELKYSEKISLPSYVGIEQAQAN